ncbi:MAG: diphthine--ammonia ligase [Candidatus Omnitrophica bacterium]|nr:diphthine--ammonia ligase [Candidatus Omnitrophota bacterium]
MKVVSLWSGGKDSCFACYKAIREGHEVVSLFNFTEPGSASSLSHGLKAELIRKQAAATGLPLFQKAMPRPTYRRDFIELIGEWKKEKGIKGIVFGDIYLEEHRDWIDKVCEEAEVQVLMPLWRIDTRKLVEDFIDAGFKSIIVRASAKLLGEEWPGLGIDRAFVKKLDDMGGIDYCGEQGEFHTFVYDGPIFKKPLEPIAGKKTLRDGYWFLELGLK